MQRNGFDTPRESQTAETVEAIQFADEIGGESKFGETGFDKTNHETKEVIEKLFEAIEAETERGSPGKRWRRSQICYRTDVS